MAEPKPEEAKSGDTNGNVEVKAEKSTKPELSTEMRQTIKRQMDYYFGDFNLARDKFLKEQISLDDGWVPMSVMLTFKRLASLSNDAEAIVSCILEGNSDIVEVSEDKTKVRRNPKNPAPEFTDDYRQELVKRTAYVKGFPKEETFENISKFMEDYGPYENINMRHYHDKATQKNVFKGSVFVTFKNEEACKKFVELTELKFGDQDLIHIWQSEFIEEKAKEREERNSKRKNKNSSNNENSEKKGPNLPKGAILHIKGLNDKALRENIKSTVTKIGGTEPVYITFEKGQVEGYVRFGDENAAVDFMKKVTDGKIDIEDAKVEVRALEGDEEEKFLDELSETLSKLRNQNRSSGRNRKRKGRGDGGPRSKHHRK